MDTVSPSSHRPLATVLRFAGAAALTFGGAFATVHLIQDGFVPLAAMVTATVAFLVLIILKKSLSPWRWLATGIVLAVLFTVFPIFYTVYLSFTNMGSGHLLTKQQAITRLTAEEYVPDGSPSYAWEAYKGTDGSWELLLVDGDGNASVATPGQAARPFTLAGDPPATLDGRRLLDAVEKVQAVQALSTVEFGAAPQAVKVLDLGTAAAARPKYQYDAAHDTMTDLSTGTTYAAVRGTFTSSDGQKLVPGFIVGTGADNYARFLGNEGYFKPLAGMIVWNLAFSLLSVLISFAIGMVIALLFDDLPGKRFIRALLIIPYPVPVLVSLMVWRGLLNENMGLVTNFLTSIFGSAPAFFTDPTWARFAVILINVYLSYPYFFVLASGAMRSISKDLYEAAEIDGASRWVVLRTITMPLILRILMPLLIASFSFNFNNFTIIWGYNAGLPAMADTIVPMGETDLLISFIYRLGFSSSNAADYGFSAAITVILFLFVGLMVYFQTRNARSIKEAN